MLLETEFPIAINSLDHIYPNGTKNDNNTSLGLIKELEIRVRKPFKLVDMGCAGGQFVIDVNKQGNIAIGLEGSDYNRKHSMHNWPKYDNEFLFTCDISKPFSILESENSPFIADIFTAWEVLEHLSLNDLDICFSNIKRHLSPSGVFLVSIGYLPNPISDTLDHHVTKMSKYDWYTFLEKYWTVGPYLYASAVRGIAEYSHMFELYNK